MTIDGNQLVLFLSFYRIDDLDTTLNRISPLPIGDTFSNGMVWSEDDQISAELMRMYLLALEQWGMPLPLAQSSEPVINAEHDGRHWRRIPEPMRLLDDAVERSSWGPSVISLRLLSSAYGYFSRWAIWRGTLCDAFTTPYVCSLLNFAILNRSGRYAVWKKPR